MEVPAYHMDRSMEQDHAMLTAMAWLMDEGFHDEIQDPHELASDLVKKLHEAGYMIVPCKQFEINDK